MGTTKPNGTNNRSTNVSLLTNDSILKYFTYINIRGLQPKTVQSKIPMLSDILHEKNQLFLALSETWLRNELDAEVKIDGYDLFRCDKKAPKKKFGRNSGGVAVFIREDISPTFNIVSTYSNGGVELLTLASDLLKLVISCVYRQPDSSNDLSADIFKKALMQLNRDLLKYPDFNYVIMGDFNLPHVDWKSMESNSHSSKQQRNIFDSLQTFMDEHFLQVYVPQKPQKKHMAANFLLRIL